MKGAARLNTTTPPRAEAGRGEVNVGAGRAQPGYEPQVAPRTQYNKERMTVVVYKGGPLPS
jgi:hypothetical protein